MRTFWWRVTGMWGLRPLAQNHRPSSSIIFEWSIDDPLRRTCGSTLEEILGNGPIPRPILKKILANVPLQKEDEMATRRVLKKMWDITEWIPETGKDRRNKLLWIPHQNTLLDFFKSIHEPFGTEPWVAEKDPAKSRSIEGNPGQQRSVWNRIGSRSGSLRPEWFWNEEDHRRGSKGSRFRRSVPIQQNGIQSSRTVIGTYRFHHYAGDCRFDPFHGDSNHWSPFSGRNFYLPSTPMNRSD